jgi:hypothetical protein
VIARVFSEPPGVDRDGQHSKRSADDEIAPEADLNPVRLRALCDDQVRNRANQRKVAGIGETRIIETVLGGELM